MPVRIAKLPVPGATWAGNGITLMFGADVVLGPVGFVAYLFHRRWPVGVAVFTTLLGAVAASATGGAVFNVPNERAAVGLEASIAAERRSGQRAAASRSP